MHITTRRFVLTGSALALTGALSLGLASPSLATPTTTPAGTQGLDTVKADGAAAIAGRQAQLTKLAGRLASAPNCDSSGHVASEIAADGPALGALGTKLAADTTAHDTRTDFQAIFDQYRVYLVVTPQAYTTSACGHIESAVTRLTDDQHRLTTRVQAAADGGADMTAAQQSLADMTAKLADASAKANDANSTLAAIAPDNGDKSVAAANAVAVANAHADLVTAHGDLKAAVADAHAVVEALKALKGK